MDAERRERASVACQTELQESDEESTSSGLVQHSSSRRARRMRRSHRCERLVAWRDHLVSNRALISKVAFELIVAIAALVALLVLYAKKHRKTFPDFAT